MFWLSLSECGTGSNCFIVNRLVVEKEDRIIELEMAVERAAEATVDKDRLLEVMHSDKTALSRAVAQNKELKNQLAELQNSFIKMVCTVTVTLCQRCLCGFSALSWMTSVPNILLCL